MTPGMIGSRQSRNGPVIGPLWSYAINAILEWLLHQCAAATVTV